MTYCLGRIIAPGLLLASAVSFGCGSTSDGGPPAAAGAAGVAGATGANAGAPPVTGGGGGAAATGGQSSSAGGSAAGRSGASGDSEASDAIGTLQVVRVLPGEPQAGARFDLVEQAAWDALGTSACTEQTFGACVVTTCPVANEMDPPSVPTPPSSARLDAGTITITSDVDPFSATGAAGSNGLYVFQASGSLGGGGLLTFNATGGTISAFTGTIPLPLAPLLLVPSLDGLMGTTDIAVPRTADFNLSWDARGASEKIQIVVTKPANDPAISPYMRCTFAAAAGAGTFQAGALSQLPAGTRIRLFGLNHRTLETAQGSVQLLAAYEMISSDKMAYPSLVLQ